MLRRIILALIICLHLLLLPFVLIGVTVFHTVWRVLIWREATVRWFQKRQARDPNDPGWAAWLGYLYQCRMKRTSGAVRKEAAKQVVAHYERWLFLQREITHDYSKLSNLAVAAVEAGMDEKAERYALHLLELPDQFPRQNFGNAIHFGNVVLGRVGLRRGEIDKAKEYLLRAGKTPGSPQLDSYGPSVTLAKELLEAGERDTVLEYFDLCALFWRLDGGALKRWSREVREGNIPDFGRQLNRG